MTFRSSDGLRLEGRVFGSGRVGVVLAHGVEEDAQGSWFPFARVLAVHGYRALTFDLRGFCPRAIYGCSEGSDDPPNTWHDVQGAVDYLRSQGAEKIFLVGASLGARSVLWAAAQTGVDVAGVIPLSASRKAAAAYSPDYDFTTRILRLITEPKLFIAGRDEPEAAPDARSMYTDSNQPKQILLLPSGQHAWELVTTAEPQAVEEGTKAILAFIAAND